MPLSLKIRWKDCSIYNPEAGREFIKLLANDVREKRRAIATATHNSVRKRMVEVDAAFHRQAGDDDNFK